ncbi:LuxR C-terminal-related transcriptional regulator [Jatrophihabitans telluris]|uniref:LuxR C-terminal-related transcriptional regulator n=1 Tax=Jatrophihabitans telluris TaxID=2038343 RepID=A0ABY4R089_9ACTN|nr:LuxR C-terminal-related transcriptional regulator [Jatrophihabitans telluris]UQX89321.1 LuxR C-terminal-related transcriptional regulator [Jatrophihabitans telluris]
MTHSALRVSEREAEVLSALGQHLSNAQIASLLHLSVRTVETHVSSLLRKLGAADRRELAELAPSLASVDPPSSTAGSRGVPATWTPFIGREREQKELIQALDTSRVVTLLGPGGVGKTRLAGEVARTLASRLPLGATFVELVSSRPGFFVQTVASALDVRERPGQALRDAILARLRPGRALLVLDNCEHLVDDTAEFLTALLGQATDLRVLTTSRARIGVPGERVVPLSGLSLVARSTGGAADSEAVTLFFDRARMLDAQFDADPAAVGELCAQLDGMPLAIELATARSATLGIAGLRAGLTDRLRLLSGGQSGDERHRSLRAVLDWSHELLDGEEQAALRRLGRFAGPFDLEAAAAVTALPPAVVVDLVGRLSDKSLLVHRQGSERWSLLETVRAYAWDKLGDAGERDQVTDRYVRWAKDVSAEIESRLVRGQAWQADFDAVSGDLRAALALADGELAAAVARCLGHLTFARRFLVEARTHYLRAAELATDEAQAVQDLWSAAGVAQVESKGQLRYEYAVAAAQRAAAAGDHGTQAAVLAEAVSVATRFPAIFERDIELTELQRMLRLAHDVAPPDDPVAEAQLMAADAWTETRLVEVPDVVTFQAAFDAAERAGDALLISAALDALGAAQVMGGHFAKTHELGARRLSLLARLPAHQPRAGSEIHDIVHMSVENAVSAGAISFALETARRFADDELVAAAPQMVESKPIVPLVLLGRFDEATMRGERTREAWESAGRPAARWMAPSMYSLVLCRALRGEDAAASEWRSFAGVELAGAQTRNVHFQVGGMASFVEARLALHFSRFDDASSLLAGLPTAKDAWWHARHWYFDAYPWAVTAELAVAVAHPDASACLVALEPAARENPWAAAYLARARARLSGDPADFLAALTAWEALDARYERACTLAMIPSRFDEACADLDSLGVSLPVQR